MTVNLLLAFTLIKDLGLLLSSLDLGSVLLFLDLLSGGLDLGNNGVSDQSVLWLKLLGLIKRVVDQTEASGLATTELGLEAEDEQSLWVVDLVHLAELFLQFSVLQGLSAWVKNINDLHESKR